MANDYRKPALKPATDTDLAESLRRLLEKRPDLTLEVNEELKDISAVREATADSAKAASGVELSPEQTELLNNLKSQYPAMKSALERHEISTEGMPTWEQIKQGLTPEVLDKALKLAGPALLLIPPTTRQSKVEAINNHPVSIQKCDTYTYKLDDNDLWNGGEAETSKEWRVKIDEGVQDVKQDPEIYDGKRTNYEMTKMWVAKLEAQGLDVMSGADTYLTLMMKALAEGKPVDPKTYTVLNGKNLTKSSLVAYGGWDFGRVGLYDADPDDTARYLRLRGSVGVDVR